MGADCPYGTEPETRRTCREVARMLRAKSRLIAARQLREEAARKYV